MREIGRLNQLRKQTEALLNLIVEHVPSDDQFEWLLDCKEPTAFDAHVVSYLARLQDAGNGELVPLKSKAYLEKAKDSKYWREVMGDRPTLR